jgi:hypothetical protein
MSILSWFHNRIFGPSFDEPTRVNPATGLPMVGAVDVQGNPYGIDISPPTPPPPTTSDHWDSHSCHDHWPSGGGSHWPD